MQSALEEKFTASGGSGNDVQVRPAQPALTSIRDGHCGVLLVCYSLLDTLRLQIITAFRESCPNGRVVVISNKAMDKPDFADGLVHGVEGPEALIEAIRDTAQ